MADSRKIFRVNVQGMIVEEIDGPDSRDPDKADPRDRSEVIVFSNTDQAVYQPAGS